MPAPIENQGRGPRASNGALQHGAELHSQPSVLLSQDVLATLETLQANRSPQSAAPQLIAVLAELGLLKLVSREEIEVERKARIAASQLRLVAPDLDIRKDQIGAEKAILEKTIEELIKRRQGLLHRIFSRSKTLEGEDAEIAQGQRQIQNLQARSEGLVALGVTLRRESSATTAAEPRYVPVLDSTRHAILTPLGNKVLAALRNEGVIVRELTAEHALLLGDMQREDDGVNREARIAEVTRQKRQLAQFDLVRLVMNWNGAVISSIPANPSSGEEQPASAQSLPCLGNPTESADLEDTIKSLLTSGGALDAARIFSSTYRRLSDEALAELFVGIGKALLDDGNGDRLKELVLELTAGRSLGSDVIKELTLYALEKGEGDTSTEILIAAAKQISLQDFQACCIAVGNERWSESYDEAVSFLEAVKESLGQGSGQVLLGMVADSSSSNEWDASADLVEEFLGALSSEALASLAVLVTDGLLEHENFSRASSFFDAVESKISDTCVGSLIAKNVIAIMKSSGESLTDYTYFEGRAEAIAAMPQDEVGEVLQVANGADNEAHRAVLTALHTRIPGDVLAKSVAELVSSYIEADEENEAEELLDTVAMSVPSAARVNMIVNVACGMLKDDPNTAIIFVRKCENGNGYGVEIGEVAARVAQESNEVGYPRDAATIIQEFADAISQEQLGELVRGTLEELKKGEEWDEISLLWDRTSPHLAEATAHQIAVPLAVNKIIDDQDDGVSFVNDQRQVFKSDFPSLVIAVAEAALREDNDDSKEMVRAFIREFRDELPQEKLGELAKRLL